MDVPTKIERSFGALETFPNCSVHPKALLEYGNRDFREVYFNPYRIIYRVLDREVSSCSWPIVDATCSPC